MRYIRVKMLFSQYIWNRVNNVGYYERKVSDMEELKKLNRRIAAKQMGRLIGGVGSVIAGIVLIRKFIHHVVMTVKIRRAYMKTFAKLSEEES